MKKCAFNPTMTMERSKTNPRIIFILTFVMPKMAVVFADTATQLPLPTVIVMGVSHFLKHWWLPLLISAVISFVTFARWRQTTQGAWAIGSLVLKVFLADI